MYMIHSVNDIGHLPSFIYLLLTTVTNGATSLQKLPLPPKKNNGLTLSYCDLILQKLPTLPEHMGSHQLFCEVMVDQSLVSLCCFVDDCFCFSSCFIFLLPLYCLSLFDLIFSNLSYTS